MTYPCPWFFCDLISRQIHEKIYPRSRIIVVAPGAGRVLLTVAQMWRKLYGQIKKTKVNIMGDQL